VSEFASVELDFIDRAPIRVNRKGVVDAPVEAVFTAIASDPSGWGRWLPGFSTTSTWVSPPPHGLGSKRTMRAFGTSFEETVLAWNANEEFAFRLDTGSLPAVTGLAERWRVRAVGVGSTELTWSVAVDSPWPAPLLRAFLSLVTRVLLGVAVRRLATVVVTDGETHRP
jgi:hypothetical protein